VTPRIRSATRYEGAVKLGKRERGGAVRAGLLTFEGLAAPGTGAPRTDFSFHQPLHVQISWYPESHSNAQPPSFSVRNGEILVALELHGPGFDGMFEELWRLCDVAEELDVTFTVVDYEEFLGTRIDDLLLGKRVKLFENAAV
jgi:hypothetical protein